MRFSRSHKYIDFCYSLNYTLLALIDEARDLGVTDSMLIYIFHIKKAACAPKL